jgi:hypothetical protein
MSKGTARNIFAKGLKQETLPVRLRLTLLTKDNDTLIYEGWLSTAPLTSSCFGKYDKPLKFFLTIKDKTQKAIISI